MYGFQISPGSADGQPNLVPPLTSTEAVLAYKSDLEAIDPSTEYLMTLYLHQDVTPDEIRKAAKAGIRGESSYLSQIQSCILMPVSIVDVRAFINSIRSQVVPSWSDY